jgi:hypothetical protein
MKVALVICTSLLLSPAAAVANPVRVMQELGGQAIAGVHVRLTYTSNYGPTPASVTKHGSSQSPWVAGPSSTYDLGSGSQPVGSVVMCDCHVPTSTTLDYRVYFSDGSSSTVNVQVAPQENFDTYPTSQDCIAPCQAADAADAGLPPTSTGGTTATGGTPGSGGSAIASSGTAATGGAPGTEPKGHGKGGGCALLAMRAWPALPSLALLGLALVAWRRRP